MVGWLCVCVDGDGYGRDEGGNADAKEKGKKRRGRRSRSQVYDKVQWGGESVTERQGEGGTREIQAEGREE